jgi:hypothetical protein
MINGKIHYKWSFPIATLNYQRVHWKCRPPGHVLGGVVYPCSSIMIRASDRNISRGIGILKITSETEMIGSPSYSAVLTFYMCLEQKTLCHFQPNARLSRERLGQDCRTQDGSYIPIQKRTTHCRLHSTIHFKHLYLKETSTFHSNRLDTLHTTKMIEHMLEFIYFIAKKWEFIYFMATKHIKRIHQVSTSL